MPIELELPPTYARWVAPRGWLEVHVAAEPAVRFHGRRAPLTLHRLPQPLGEPELHAFVARLSRQGGAVVVSSILPAGTRRLLEAADVGYLDSRGNVHVALPTGVIHVDALPGVRRVAASGLGPHGVRAVQAILASGEPLSVSALAKQASLSLSQTHGVFQILESNGMVRPTGVGRSRPRVVVSPSELLDWLEVQPVARRRDQRLDVSLYARRPEELWSRVGELLGRSGIAHGLTGSAAAALLGCGPTTVLTSTVRIDPEVPLESAARALEAAPTDRGPNLRLVRDTGRVGSSLTEERGIVRLAPKVRIYLDALSERRGEDVARQFREVVLGY